MRSKEDAHDYRYFPDPDLLPIKLEQSFVDRIKSELPEMPDVRKARFMADYGLPEYDARILTSDKERADFYEAVAKGRDPKIASNWTLTESWTIRFQAKLPKASLKRCSRAKVMPIPSLNAMA